MKILLARHTTTADLSIYIRWAESRNHELVIADFARKQVSSITKLEDFDCLISTGGPQSAAKLSEHSELEEELALLKAFQKLGRPLLGVCLGGQLLSYLFDGVPTRASEPEFGYFTIQLTEEGKADPFFSGIDKEFKSLQWHYDQIGVPKSAALLASSQGCPIQAVRFDKKTYGLQFHLDFTRDTLIKSLKEIIDNPPPGNYVQPSEEMLLADFNAMGKLMGKLLDNFCRLPLPSSAGRGLG